MNWFKIVLFRWETMALIILILWSCHCFLLILSGHSTSIMAQFPMKEKDPLFDLKDFWKHSLLCGIISKKISSHIGIKNSDEIFMCGLLHDFGKLILYNFLLLRGCNGYFRSWFCLPRDEIGSYLIFMAAILICKLDDENKKNQLGNTDFRTQHTQII